MQTKYQCHPKRRGMLNPVPKFAECEMRSTFFLDKFSKSKNEIIKIPEFSEKTVQWYLKKIIYTMYPFNRNVRSMLNHVSKFPQCEKRSKIFHFQAGFQSRKPKQKNFKIQKFSEKVFGNLVKMIYTDRKVEVY